MNKHKHGLTIVELIIVVTVIAVLAGVVAIGFRGVQQRADATSRMTELSQWEDLLDVYMAEYRRLPITGQTLINNGTNESTYCLGTGFPDTDYRPAGYNTGSCRTLFPCGAGTTCANDYKRGHVEPTLNTELAKVGTLPTGPRNWPNGEGALGVLLSFDSTTQMDIGQYFPVYGGNGSCPEGYMKFDEYPVGTPRVIGCNKKINL